MPGSSTATHSTVTLKGVPLGSSAGLRPVSRSTSEYRFFTLMAKIVSSEVWLFLISVAWASRPAPVYSRMETSLSSVMSAAVLTTLEPL